MPAETHQQRDDVTASEIVDVMVAVLAPSADLNGDGLHTLLTDLGVNSDLALFDLRDVVAENTASAPSARLASMSSGRRGPWVPATVFARLWGWAGENGHSTGRGDST